MTDRKQSEAPNVERSTPHSTKFAECIIFLVGLVVIAAWWFWPSVLSPMLKRTVPNVDPLSAHPPWLMGMEPVADSAATADSYLAQLGQMGDTFGSINALFAALTVVAVFWAGYLQRVTLKEAQQQISNQDAELKAQRESRNLAQFERNFYELLKLTIAVSNRFRVQSKNGMPLTGSAAFDAVASHYFGGVAIDSIATGSGVDQLDRLVDIYRTEVYGRFSAKIGPWFRLFYQIFDFIDSAEITTKDKIRFSKIARGQMSEGTVLLLALNGVTNRGFRFVRHIECFGLLEHMHPGYLREYGSDLLTFYDKNAFLGSKQRANRRVQDSSIKYSKAALPRPAANERPEVFDPLPTDEIKVNN